MTFLGPVRQNRRLPRLRLPRAFALPLGAVPARTTGEQVSNIAQTRCRLARLAACAAIVRKRHEFCRAMPRIVITALLLAWAGLATAQTSSKLVGNTGQTEGEENLHLLNDRAISFVTGSDSRGYTLTGVDLRIIEASAPPAGHTYTMSIHADSVGPASHLGTLRNPASWPSAHADVRFSASGSGIYLTAHTTYWVVFDVTAGPLNGPRSIHATTSDGQDDGAAPDWALDGVSLLRVWNTSDWDGDLTFFPRFAVWGYAGRPVLPESEPEPEPEPEPVPALPAAGLALLAFVLAVRGARGDRTRAAPPTGSRHCANADRPR